MKCVHFALAAVLAIATLPALAASTRVTDPNLPRELPVQGPVSVSWTDPALFSDIRNSPNKWESERGTWVHDLAEYLRKQTAKDLQPGQTLEVRITDIRRAGQYEPWHGPSTDHIRIMKDVYPPRMTFDFTLRDADGRVLEQGQRKLTDLGYLTGARPLDHDSLRFEKRMIDQWSHREFDDDRKLSAGP
jgi:hypothetical protein